MRKTFPKILIPIFVFMLISCDSKLEKFTEIANSEIESERYFPKEILTKKFDTLLADRQIRLQISRTDLDTYVSREYEIDDKLQIDNYRDAEISLMISRDSKILLDTVFEKRQFLKYADKNFIDSSVFHDYWFEGLADDRLKFLGTISIPETDIGFEFEHDFDLKSNQLSFELLTEAEQ